MKKKIITDILMFILIILEFSKGYMLSILHEIFGILLLILIIIHLILNKSYIKNIPKGKYNISRTIMLLTNIGFMITFVISLIFGLLSSQDILTFINIHNFNIIKLHKIFAYISLIFMGLHLGINFNTIFSKTNKLINNKIIIYIIELTIIIYGIYSSIKLDIIKHIIGTYGFSIIEGNILLNILRYLCIIIMISIIMHNINKLIKKGDKNER